LHGKKCRKDNQAVKQDHTYTAADIYRYRSGTMSDAEMHALEKAALEDPFLADALEGYANTTTPSEDIAELRERLFEKRKKKNTFFAISKENNWLRIAAIFILIAGVGYFVYLVNTGNRKSGLVSLQDTGLKKAEQPVTAGVDSLSIADTASQNFSVAEKAKPDAINSKTRTMVSDSKVLKEVSQTAAVQKDKATAVLSKSQNDRVGYRDAVAVREAAVAKNEKSASKIFLKDSERTFQVPARDSALTGSVAAADVQSIKEKTVEGNKQEVGAVKKTLQEVVVTGVGVGRQKKEAATSNKLQKQASEISADNTAPKPLTDTERFNEYVRQHIVVPSENSGNPYKGKLILSFEVNKKGKPKKVTVIQSLCASCDEEGRRLLIKGPKWEYQNGKRQTVTIEF
jgi:hypothetical protein